MLVIQIVNQLLAIDFYSAFIICGRFSYFSVNCRNVELRFCNIIVYFSISEVDQCSSVNGLRVMNIIELVGMF